jgi:hypothetical protein
MKHDRENGYEQVEFIGGVWLRACTLVVRASAAPFSQGADATLRAASTLNSIQNVHGTHRGCVDKAFDLVEPLVEPFGGECTECRLIDRQAPRAGDTGSGPTPSPF